MKKKIVREFLESCTHCGVELPESTFYIVANHRPTCFSRTGKLAKDTVAARALSVSDDGTVLFVTHRGFTER